MLPIFNEYIKFLNHKTKDKLNFLKEGIYWYDKSIIKAFDKNGNLVKIARLNIDDNLEITVKFYNKQIPELETWNDTIIRCQDELYKIEKESKELIANSIHRYSDRKVAILSSGERIVRLQHS